MISGSITLGNDQPGNKKITTQSPAYACRPPGTIMGHSDLMKDVCF